MEKFEYKILNISRAHLKREGFQAELIERLNELGNEGWELINAEGLNEASVFSRAAETVEVLFLLKRKTVW
jgi:hypothetical protein